MMKLNNTIKTIIADDELLARNVIKKYLLDFPEIELIAECDNGINTLNKINELSPDLVFLDIQMPELDGLSVLKELKNMPLVIFTTAFNQYAIKAFELHAIDYLLKPFDKDRFSLSIQKVIEHKGSMAYFERKINKLQQSLSDFMNIDNKLNSRILIKNNDSYSFINTSEILWFEAYSDYVKIHTLAKSYLKNISLNELESKLDPKQFIRIHRSTIINIHFIKEMKPYFNGEYFIFLNNGEKLKLSRTYKDKIKLLINESF